MTEQELLESGLIQLKKSDFDAALGLFQDYVGRNPADPAGLYYLGIAYIYNMNYRSAFKYLSRCVKFDSAHLDALNAIAFIQLKQGLHKRALKSWLDILDLDKTYAPAKRNLSELRKGESPEIIAARAMPREFVPIPYPQGLMARSFFSSIKRAPVFNNHEQKKTAAKPFKLNLPVVIVVLALVGLFFLIPVINRMVNRPAHLQRFVNQTNLAYLESIALPQMDDYVLMDDAPHMYSFSNDEIEARFKKVKRLLGENRVNTAIVTVNEVLHSNASDEVKQRFLALRSLIDPPAGWIIPDEIEIQDIINQPTINDGVYIVWSGVVSDVDVSGGNTTFRLLVNYQTGRSLHAVALVLFHGTSPDLYNGARVQIIGRFAGVADTAMRELKIDGFKIAKI